MALRHNERKRGTADDRSKDFSVTTTRMKKEEKQGLLDPAWACPETSD